MGAKNTPNDKFGPGNLSAFLVQGNASKLSLDKAFQLVRYLEAA